MLKSALKFECTLLGKGGMKFLGAIYVAFHTLIFFAPHMFPGIVNGIEYIPMTLYKICEFFLPLLLGIALFYNIGQVFRLKLDELVLSASPQKWNVHLLYRFYANMFVYTFLFLFTYMNLYRASHINATNEGVAMGVSLLEGFLRVYVVNIFVAVLSLFVLVIVKDITSSVVAFLIYFIILEYYYNLNEFLLGEKMLFIDMIDSNWVLGNKLMYLGISAVLFYAALWISCRSNEIAEKMISNFF